MVEEESSLAQVVRAQIRALKGQPLLAQGSGMLELTEEGNRTRRTESRPKVRHVLRRLCLAVCATTIGLLLFQQLMEHRDAARYLPDQLFQATSFGTTRYALQGSRESPPVVLLTGATGVLEQWEATQHQLATRFATLAYDRGGTGFSHSTAHDANAQADELSELLDELGLKQPAIVVAYSLSANVARVFGHRHPTRTRGLVLLDPELPELRKRIPHRHIPLRKYGRWYAQDTLSAVLGLARLRWYVTGRGPMTMALADSEPRAHAAMFRTSHWWAVDRELLAVGTSERQLASYSQLTIPISFLISTQAQPTLTGQAYLDTARRLSRQSREGRIVPLNSTSHTALLKDQESIDQIAAAVANLASRTQASSSPPPPQTN